MSDEVKRKVHVVQRPPRLDHFDIEALNSLGEVEYLTPVAPNIHDAERITADYARMLKSIVTARPDDVFVALGGSPISNWLFGAALFASGAKSINVAMYSRDIDEDGRRLDKGRYRIVEMVTEFPEDA
ncbi:MAG TPA: hypothetical protein VFS17_04285 [Methylophilaceae bacterium]|jgi:hypothetical protein|nr:hypothetical protein [Methylophilaceae bacterium]